MCSAFASEYENATTARNAEKTLLGQLNEFIRQEAEVFGDYGTGETSG